MKYTVLLFSALFFIMTLIPLIAFEMHPEHPANMQEISSVYSQKEKVPLPSSQSAPSSRTEEEIAVSHIVSMQEPVLLYDRASGEILRMSQQEYVLGAVCSELPPSFHPEAIKAQAVAAHSYMLRCRQQELKSPSSGLHGAYLAIDTSKREGYVSEAAARAMYGEQFDLYYPEMKKLVAEVENEILLYDEQPIVAAYHAISAGRTEDASNVWSGSAEYLIPVDSPGDRLSPGFESTETFTPDEVRSRLTEASPDISLSDAPEEWFHDIVRSDSGYITSIGAGDTDLSGQKLRTSFGQRSSCLSIDYRGGVFVFTATGYGHGVGLSQYGADYMGRQGADYREILAHYYPGSVPARLT